MTCFNCVSLSLPFSLSLSLSISLSFYLSPSPPSLPPLHLLSLSLDSCLWGHVSCGWRHWLKSKPVSYHHYTLSINGRQRYLTCDHMTLQSHVHVCNHMPSAHVQCIVLFSILHILCTLKPCDRPCPESPWGYSMYIYRKLDVNCTTDVWLLPSCMVVVVDMCGSTQEPLYSWIWNIVCLFLIELFPVSNC